MRILDRGGTLSEEVPRPSMELIQMRLGPLPTALESLLLG